MNDNRPTKKHHAFKHGHNIDGKTTPEYRAWQQMKDRCYNENNTSYKQYGGRGIKICERWFDFIKFYEDMGKRPTSKHGLKRIDKNIGYMLTNCYWAIDKKASRYVHGQSKRYNTTPEYRAWRGMLNRCLNEKAKCHRHYGGRGIKVCTRWADSFINFFADMGKRPSSQHSLDRINNDYHYCPENCRWATTKEQQANRREVKSCSLPNFTLEEIAAELKRRKVTAAEILRMLS